MEGAEAHVLPPAAPQHHVFTHHIDDVSPLLDGLDGAGMKPGNGHGQDRRLSIVQAAAAGTSLRGARIAAVPPAGG